MSINLVQWEGSTVTPKLDAIMYDDGSYGIIKGCSITHQGTNLLKIANGFIKIAGRLIEITEETIQCQVSASGTVNGQLWLRLDLSSVTPAVFMSEAAAVLTPLTQNADCNFQNGIYELQLATYNIDESVITNLVETAPELEKMRGLIDEVASDVDEVASDVDEINNNLSGFKFYPTGTAIVGLVADDSPYEDADGNYILADSATGRGLIDGVTYKSINSTEDTRGKEGADTASPFKSGADYLGFNFYNAYDCNKVTLQNNITHFEYFPSNLNNPLFTVSKYISGVGANDYFAITLTANKQAYITFECEYTEGDSSPSYPASVEIKFNDVNILAKHTIPTTAVTNTIRENISLQANDTITLKFYENYGAWNGKITVK